MSNNSRIGSRERRRIRREREAAEQQAYDAWWNATGTLMHVADCECGYVPFFGWSYCRKHEPKGTTSGV